jgi:hypothetical protein
VSDALIPFGLACAPNFERESARGIGISIAGRVSVFDMTKNVIEYWIAFRELGIILLFKWIVGRLTFS